MGLTQEHTDSLTTQSAVCGSTSFNNTSTQGLGAPPPVKNPQPYDDASFAQNYNTNAPVFDFGSSEWSDILQANDDLDTDASLPQGGGMDPYIGFDIPFWLGQDQYWDMLHDRN